MSARVASRRPRSRGPTGLSHWAEVSTEPRRAELSASVVPVVRDLVSWASDIAVVLTRHCPEDQAAIERVRRSALAWLDGETTLDVSIDDVLMTVATLMSAVDKNIGGTLRDVEHVAQEDQVWS
jgi:predicted protein tyrosine phosphatase